AAGTRTLYTDDAGQVGTTGFGQLTANATYGTLSGTATAAAVEGQTIALTVTLAPTSLSGFVVDLSGAPLAGRQVYLYYANYGWYIGNTVTDGAGAFRFE